MSTPSKGDELFNSGLKFFSEKAYKKALEEWKLALEIYQREGRKRAVGVVSTYIAQALEKRRLDKEALVSCTKAVRILRDVGDPKALRSALQTMGRVMEKLGYFDEAIRALEQAVDIQLKAEDTEERVSLLIEVAQALERTGRYEQGSVRILEAIRLAESLPKPELKGEALATYTRVLHQLNEHERAEKVLQSLIQLYQKLNKPNLIAHARLGLASTYLSKGELEKAEPIIQQTQKFFVNSDDEAGKALAEYHLARLLFLKGNPEEALPHGEKALQSFKEQKNLLAEGQTSILIAQILEQLVQDVRALRMYDTALELFTKTGEHARQLDTHVMKGKALVRLNKQKQAEAEFTTVIRYYREHRQPHKEAQLYLEIADLMNQLGKYSEAIEQSKLALEQLQVVQDEAMEMHGYLLLINAAKNANRIEEHIPIFQKAFESAQKNGKPLLVASLSVSLAQLSFDIGTPDQYIGVLEKSIHNSQFPMTLRAEAALTLGSILMKQQRYTEAAQQLSQAIKTFGAQPNFDKATAYYQLSEAYQEINKPNLRKQALTGALASLTPDADEKLRGKLYLDLALLTKTEDPKTALQYYETATKIFEKWEHPEERLTALLGQITLMAQQNQDSQAIEKSAEALLVAEELDILQTITEDLTRPWTNSQQAIEVAIAAVAQQYAKEKSQSLINKIFDWTTPRKITKLQPYLAKDLGFEQCSELPRLLQEEQRLIVQAQKLLQQLTKLPQREVAEEVFLTRREPLRKELNEAISQIQINRNVISAACPNPGMGLLPREYKMLQKLTALMPSDRRWILINYDVLVDELKIIVTTFDHVGRHGIHSLPLSADTISIVDTLRGFKDNQQLPPIADLKDIATHLYRSLVPSLLERELQTRTYGFIQLITDGFLNHVPFELLFDGREYWGLQYPLAWVPDLQFFESTLKTKALSKSVTPTILLGINSASDENVTRKDITDETVKSFLSAVPTSQTISEPIVLFGNDFNRTLLTSTLDQPRALLFFSTPTTIHHRKGEIHLQRPDSLRVIEIGVTTNFKGAPILVLDKSIQLEPQQEGQNLVAFLRHLVTAGAPSIIFTRWRPEPQLQPQFASALIRQLYQKDPIAVALLQTRRRIASKGPSPHSWLSYSLCGNPFPSLF